MKYQLPKSLDEDIRYTESLISDFHQGKITKGQLKSNRVPMGIYEQRIDGQHMIRIRCAGGYIAPQQLRRVAQVAQQVNASHIHITTRQELQIHKVDINDTIGALHSLQEAGLGTQGGGGNTIRNMLCDERAGIDEKEIFDVYPYCVELTTRLIAEKDSFSMPRKLKIAWDISEAERHFSIVNDLGFIPVIKDGERGFKVYLGGSVATQPTLGWEVFDFLTVKDVYRAAEAAKLFFNANGNRKNRHKARIRYIFYKLGEEETKRRYYEFFQQLKADETLDFAPADAAFTHKMPHTQPLRDESDSYKLWKKRYVREQKQKGRFSFVIPFLNGNASADTIAKIADYLDEFGDDVIRFTPRQAMQVRNIPEEYLPNLYHFFKEVGLTLDEPVIVNSITSCTGADTCRLGICLPKGAVRAIRKRLQKSSLDLDRIPELEINLNGCTNGCAQNAWCDLGFSGRIGRVDDHPYPAYTVWLRTKGRHQLAEAQGVIDAHDLPAFVEDYLNIVIDKQSEYSNYETFVKQEGSLVCKQLLEKYQAVPSFDEDKNYYFDWGADEIFSLSSHGQAECSAGLFDIIEIDQNIIQEKRQLLEKPADAKETAALLHDIAFSSSRMLLVTRGADPRTDEEVYQQFEKLFIEAGIVGKQYQEVVDKARNNEDLTAQKDLVLRLADTIIDLYKNMDDSLQFKIADGSPNATHVAVTEEKRAEAKDVVKKDFRGVACPMNFVKTKIALAPLPSGALLEILLDDGQPINNVPGSVRNEGHEVISTEKEHDYWRVLIKKK